MSEKIFIIGLPRTGTTSVCHAMLALGYKTAHTCYIESAMEQAQVIADTPVFHDFEVLLERYPEAKFIYLTRELSKWLPSIRQLLQRMASNLLRADGGFNPIIKRCYSEVFAPFTMENIASDEFLTKCYLRHQQRVYDFIASNQAKMCAIDLADTTSFAKLLKFLTVTPSSSELTQFVPMNIAGKVTAWKDISHPLKVESTRNGRCDALWYELS